MAAATNGLPEDPALLRARLAEVEARYAQSQVQFRGPGRHAVQPGGGLPPGPSQSGMAYGQGLA